MIHRGSTDSRLLLNLINHDKDYAKQLNSALETSDVSLTSLSAFAAASSPPFSNVILAVASALAGADEALRRYVQCLDHWRVYLLQLKDLEDDVARIMRDKEILVTRLVKASGSGSNRSSGLLARTPSTTSQQTASDEVLSTSYTQSQSSYPKHPGSSNKKLISIQSELQACLAHLAAKERQLDTLRFKAVKEGLGLRGKTIADCGKLWEKFGQEILEEVSDSNFRESRAEQPVLLSSFTTSRGTLPPSVGIQNRTSSDVSGSTSSSIGPEHSASQVNLVVSGKGPRAGSNERLDYQLTIPPAHSIPSIGLPTSLPIAPGPSTILPAPETHMLSHKITEESLTYGDEDVDSKAAVYGGKHVQEPFEVVENVRTQPRTDDTTPTPHSAKSNTASTPPKSSKGNPSGVHKVHDKARSSKVSLEHSTSGGSKLLGSIRGLFTQRSPPKTSRPSLDMQRKEESRGRTSEGWDMSRTDRNVRSSSLSRRQNSSDEEGGRSTNFLSTPANPQRRRVFSTSESKRSPTILTGARLKKPRTNGISGSPTPVPRGRVSTITSSTEANEARLRRRSRSLDHIVVDLGYPNGPIWTASQHGAGERSPRTVDPSSQGITERHQVKSGLIRTSAGNSDLSRNSSLTSARSAPSGKRANGSSQLGRGTGTRSVDDIAITPVGTVHKQPGKTKRTSLDSVHHSRQGFNPSQSQSLMAIVEDATRKGHPTTSPLSTAGHTADSFHVPKAPQSIFIIGSSKSPSTQSQLPYRKPSLSTPDKKPLRSALKHSVDSRSSSPMPSNGTTSSSLSSASNSPQKRAPATTTQTKRPYSLSSDVSDELSEYETGQENFDEDDNDSDLSTVEQPNQVVDSEASTTTTITNPQGPVPPDKERSVVSEKPPRRKSVRVSLKPTYAVMPSALDYEEPEAVYSNFDHDVSNASRGWGGNPKYKREGWDDSSDDESVNAEYMKARRRLGQAQRPENTTIT